MEKSTFMQYMAQLKNLRPRLSFGLALTIIAYLYVVYLADCIHLMVMVHSPKQPQIMSATQQLPQLDFARFWYVGKRLVVQRAADFGIRIPLPPAFARIFTLDILSPSVHPEMIWLYPPTMGLLAMISSCLPLALGFWVWRFVCLAVAAACLRHAGLGWRVILLGLASPAALLDAIGGQNGVLFAGFLVAGLLTFETKPRFGGTLAGLLSLKPQLAFVLPMILLSRRRAAALTACLLTGLILVALSVIAEGWYSWVWFFTVAEPNSARILDAPAAHMFPNGYTVLMMFRSLHASLKLAWTLQLAFSAAAAFFIWRAWYRPAGDPIARLSLTVSLALLLSPYGYGYDLVSFSIAMAAMGARATPRLSLAFALLWLTSGYAGMLANLTGLVLMPIAAISGAALSWRQMRPGRISRRQPSSA
jgi:hypothetical protein